MVSCHRCLRSAAAFAAGATADQLLPQASERHYDRARPSVFMSAATVLEPSQVPPFHRPLGPRPTFAAHTNAMMVHRHPPADFEWKLLLLTWNGRAAGLAGVGL